MKKLTIILISFIFIFLIGCGTSSSNKILDFVELNKTPEDKIIDNFNLEIDSQKVWNEEEGIYEFTYIEHYADYTLNNVDGSIHIRFEDKTPQYVNFSAEATSENMEQLLSYLVETYSKDYQEIEDYITRWTSSDLIIDYVLTDDNMVEIRWYNENN